MYISIKTRIYIEIAIAIGAFAAVMVSLVMFVPNYDKPEFDQWGRKVIDTQLRMLNLEDEIQAREMIILKGFQCSYIKKGWIDYRDYTVTAVCKEGQYTIEGETRTAKIVVYKL